MQGRLPSEPTEMSATCSAQLCLALPSAVRRVMAAVLDIEEAGQYGIEYVRG